MNTVLFDLDGTMLPMDQDVFAHGYFSELAKKFAAFGLDGKKLVECVWAGTREMIKNDGSMTNEESFWKTFAGMMGEDILKLRPQFDEFYRKEFNNVQENTGFTPLAAQCLTILRDKGYRLIAATNPIFPKDGTLNRMRWAGVDPDMFEMITTYETCSYSKPNLKYYESLLQTAGLEARDCLMAGNDLREDMCAGKLGIDTYLITDCMIADEGADLSQIKHGSYEEFKAYASSLPDIK